MAGRGRSRSVDFGVKPVCCLYAERRVGPRSVIQSWRSRVAGRMPAILLYATDGVTDRSHVGGKSVGRTQDPIASRLCTSVSIERPPTGSVSERRTGLLFDRSLHGSVDGVQSHGFRDFVRHLAAQKGRCRSRRRRRAQPGHVRRARRRGGLVCPMTEQAWAGAGKGPFCG